MIAVSDAPRLRFHYSELKVGDRLLWEPDLRDDPAYRASVYRIDRITQHNNHRSVKTGRPSHLYDKLWLINEDDPDDQKSITALWAAYSVMWSLL